MSLFRVPEKKMCPFLVSHTSKATLALCGVDREEPLNLMGVRLVQNTV